jgi:hypothetical protein
LAHLARRVDDATLVSEEQRRREATVKPVKAEGFNLFGALGRAESGL